MVAETFIDLKARTLTSLSGSASWSESSLLYMLQCIFHHLEAGTKMNQWTHDDSHYIYDHELFSKYKDKYLTEKNCILDY